MPRSANFGRAKSPDGLQVHPRGKRVWAKRLRSSGSRGGAKGAIAPSFASYSLLFVSAPSVLQQVNCLGCTNELILKLVASYSTGYLQVNVR